MRERARERGRDRVCEENYKIGDVQWERETKRKTEGEIERETHRHRQTDRQQTMKPVSNIKL